MATGHDGGGPSPGIESPRAGFRQRRASLSMEGSHLLNLLRIFAPQLLVLSRMCSSMRVSISDAPLNMSEKSPPI